MINPHTRLAALEQAGCLAVFLERHPAIDVAVDKEEALARLAGVHEEARTAAGFATHRLMTAEQIHGRGIAVVDRNSVGCQVGCDGLITSDPAVCLGIYVADCAAIYLLDPKHRAIALLHSGRKGTELGILPAAIEILQKQFDSRPEDLCIAISPCIRPPHYEVDFAAQIRAQARAAGVLQVQDERISTASYPDRYYSYRLEKGKTGRMLALLALS